MLKMIEQNKNTSAYCKIHPVWYILLVFAIIIGLFLGLYFYTPVFADSLNGIDFSSQPISVSPDRFFVYKQNGNPYYIYADLVNGNNPEVYVGCVFSSGTSYYLCAYSETSSFDIHNNNGSYIINSSRLTASYGTYYYGRFNLNLISDIQVPTFSTEDDFKLAVHDYIINPPSPVTATIIPSSSWLYLGTNSNNQSVYIQSAVLNDSAVCFYQDPSYSPGYIPAVVSKNNYGVKYRVAGIETSLSSVELVVDGVTWYSKYSSSLDFVVTTPNPDIGVASSSVSADNACIDAINLAYPSDGRANLLYYLPGGNVAYTLLSEYSDVALLQISSPSVISSSDFSSFNVRYGWASDLPSSAEDITTVSLSLLDPVTWFPSGPTDILGRSSMAQSYIDTTGHVGDYLVVFNPFAHGFSSSSDNITEEYVNPDIMINVSQIAGQKIYGVDSSFNPATGDYSYTGNGKIWDKDMSTPGNVYVDNEGKTSNPEQGGGSNSNPVTNFWTWLNGKFEELKNLFSTGHSMIQNLVGYGSDFMTSVQKLYTWLPDPVYSVLSSALVLVIIIGVVKCFL